MKPSDLRTSIGAPSRPHRNGPAPATPDRTRALALVLSLGALWAGCAGPPAAPAPSRSPGLSRATVPSPVPDGLDARVGRLITQAEVPGVVVLLVAGDSVVFERSYGHADPTVEEPMTADVVLRAGALVSLVTGLAAAHLAERGVVALDAPVGGYVPDLLDPVGDVTLEQLLTHTSGLALEFVRGPVTTDELQFAARWLTPLDVVAPPGSFVSMSRTGPLLAARAMEAATGMPFPVAVEAAVLAPLGMTRSTLRHERALELGLVPGWGHATSATPDVTRIESTPDSAVQVPVSGLYASPRDLARLVAALLTDGVVAGQRRLPAGVSAAVATPRAEPPVDGGGPLGLGSSFGEWEGQRELRLSTASGGHAAVVRLLPASRVGVVVAASGSAGGARLSDLADFVLRAALGLPERVPARARSSTSATAAPTPVTLADPEALAGTYRNGAETFEIEVAGDGFTLISGPLRLAATLESDGGLRARIEDGRLAMALRPIRDEAGTLYLYSMGRAFRRVE